MTTSKIKFILNDMETIISNNCIRGQLLNFLGRVNPIPRGLKYNLFHAGRGIYAPPMIYKKKKVFVQFLLHTPSTTKNRVTRQREGLYLKKQKNGGRFKIDECNMTGRISSIFCIFYLLALKWL